MRISTRFAVIGAVCALVSAAIAAALVVSSKRVAEEVRKNRAAADIVESVAGLRYLTLEYARQPEERVEMQWASAHKSLGSELARSSEFDSKEEQASFTLMRAAYDNATTTFAELVRAQRARQAGEGDREIMEELVRRLTAAMASRTLVMMTESFRLQDTSREEVAAAQRSVLTTVIILSAALVIVVIASMFFAFRSIAQPLARLREGTQRVGAGDLEHTIGLTGKDEVADLAREFDKMSAQLRTTTVSRDRLAESEERTRLILETALDAVVSIDSGGKITGWNPQAEAVFGWKREEILGRLLADTIIPHLRREAHRDGLRRYLATGEGVVLNKRVELSALRRDGSEFPVELSITPIRSGGVVTFSAFLRDITERKHAEDKVQAQLARLDLLNQITRAIGERQDLQSIYQVAVRSLEERMPADFCCVCRYDGSDAALTVIRVGIGSQALAMELAMSEHAAVPIDENGLSRCVRGHVVYEADIAKVPFPFPQRLASGGLRSMVIAPLQSESRVFGVLVVARRSAHAFSSSDCEFLQQLSAHVALAARQAELHGSLQRAYDDLRQTQQAVLQQERLRALGQMASGIAHDINNAISPIMLYTESLLEREPNLSPQARGNLQNIARAIDDVAATVARMREFYRQRAPQLTLTPLSLNQLVQQVAELTRARWSDMPQQRGIVIRLKTELAEDLPGVAGVEGEIREALINLVFNAVDAMPEGGELTLRTRALPGPDGALLAQVEVSDTGLGMDAETRRRCLEPFFTTKGERGTGLGLAMVYGAAQRHAADLDIQSMPGQGTTVALRFPPPPVAAAHGVATAATGIAQMQRLRVLLVDDDPLLLRSLRDMLENDGHVVVAANGGQAGIDAFNESHARGEGFGIVLTDLGMPYVDGRKVASAIKQASPATPVLLLTGWGQGLNGEPEAPDHVDEVLSKPPKLRDLRQALARHGLGDQPHEGRDSA
jgi:PAS domain S-box-containing protein